MDFILIGTIKGMTPFEKGLNIRVRETKCGYHDDNNARVNEVDYTWNIICYNFPTIKYIKTYFRIGAFVKIKGSISQSQNFDDKKAILRSMGLKLEHIEMFNYGDPKKDKKREAYNEKVLGEEKPDVDSFYKDDF